MSDGAPDGLKNGSSALAAALSAFSIVGPIAWNVASHVVSTATEDNKRHYELLLSAKHDLDRAFSDLRADYQTLCGVVLADSYHQLVDGAIAAEIAKSARSVDTSEEKRRRNRDAQEKNLEKKAKVYESLAKHGDLELALYDLRGTSASAKVRRLSTSFEKAWHEFAVLVERDSIEEGRTTLRLAAKEVVDAVNHGATVNLTDNEIYYVNQLRLDTCAQSEAQAQAAYYDLSEALSAEIALVSR